MQVDTLYYLDKILTVVFFLETSLKLLAMGVVAYFGNAWCWLDFVIVGVSLINFAASLLGAGNISIFKTMRTLRALRPLRAMAKMEGMKVHIENLNRIIQFAFINASLITYDCCFLLTDNFYCCS